MGSIGQRHLENLRMLHPAGKIYVVSSTGANKSLPEYADRVMCLDELLSCKPQYVIVASPAPYHVSMAENLLLHNIPVLIEKPLAHNLHSCLSSKELFNKTNLNKVAVGYCLRFLTSAQVVKKCIEGDCLGKIYNVNAKVGQYLPDWRSDKDYRDSVSADTNLGGGALLELSHEIDYLYWLLGDLHLQHSWLRTTDELGLGVEDIVNLNFSNKNDTYISLHMDFIQKSTQRECEFVGEHGRLVWNLMENSVIFYNREGENVFYSEPDYNKNEMYIKMLTQFESLITGMGSGGDLASIDSAIEVMKLVEQAKQENKWRLQI